MRHVRERVIVALDRPTPGENDALVEHLGDAVAWYKVGYSLFFRQGPAAVRSLRERGHNVFLDAKFHDIPNTVSLAVGAACEMGANLVTVHSCGGQAMLRAAAEASKAHGDERARVLAVTVLTSNGGEGVEDTVRRAAELAHASGCDGIICSPREAALVRADQGRDFTIVTPGIRFESGKDDQARTATPAHAIRAGADLLVIGRPIYGAEDPITALKQIEKDLESA